MTDASKYRPHKVKREDRADGTILLTSGYEMSGVVETTADWVHRWAADAPERCFLAERSGAGWREVSYAETLAQVRAVAAALVARGMGPETPILIISGNGVDHGILTLAAQYVGVPTVPVAEQYSLIPGAQTQLQYVLGLIDPKMVYAVDGDKFGGSLAMPEMAGRELVVSQNVPQGMTEFADLLKGDASADVDAARAKVGPDSVVKILMTSGSTSAPKGVMTTQRMMCANQTMIADALPFLRTHPPVIVDWLPWNHVFGGSHNFNMMLANGGSLYIDEGKPVPALIGKSIENNRMVSATMAFNVPVGFAMMRDAMRDDAALRESYFRNLDMLFYAGASLPQDVWRDLSEMALDVRGDVPLMNSSWGLTETAPATLIQHEPTDRSGIVGVPMTGVTIKLIPESDDRFEVRAKGPNIMPGYFKNPEKTAEAFDDEGFFCTGDAMAFVDPDDMNLGLRFDGRISEDFKLMSGTWVRAATLRLELLQEFKGVAQDIVVTGADRNEVGVMIVPPPDLAAKFDATDDAGALVSDSLRDKIVEILQARADTGVGSAARVVRALVLAEPPSMADGEITAKGNLNFRKILTRRAALLERLYSGDDAAVAQV
jgi:feruloyl-CoA synthase